MNTDKTDLTGRFAVVTGASSGIGRATAEELARRGATVVLACRSEERARPVLDAIRARGGDARFEALELGDLDSVRACAARVAAAGRPVDVLINNAGVSSRSGVTSSGFELAFGTNHVGHFLLTMLLGPALRSAGRARVVTVASDSHFQAKGIDWDAVRARTRSWMGLSEYAVSKLSNVLFTRELGRRVGAGGVRSYALHPGLVATNVWSALPGPLVALAKPFLLSPDEGARTTLWCATSPEPAEHQGRYYLKMREKEPSRAALDGALAAELWERSVRWTGADW